MPVTATRSAVRFDHRPLRYAQCWEDADVLLAGLDVRPGETCLSIASGGDNSLSLLASDPARVIAVDLSPAQVACLELKVAAFRTLDHPALLAFLGVTPSATRLADYRALRGRLSPVSRGYWDGRPADVAGGILAAGRFERYLALFRRRVLPLAHPAARCERLFAGSDRTERRRFYDDHWDNRRWRWLFRGFFCRSVMARLGRSPAFFRQVQGEVAGPLLARIRSALVELDPRANPYLQWMVRGRFGPALPHALRPENHRLIRARLDRLEWRTGALETLLAELPPASIDRFNLSNLFEYVDEEHYQQLLQALLRVGRTGGRLLYWNLFVRRHRPPELADRLQPLTALAARLRLCDRVFFYHDLAVEAIRR